MMTSERWQRLTELFDSALQQEAGRRAIFLAEACADDPELRRDVEQLLDSHEHAGSFGEDPAFRIGIARAAGTLEGGARLGRYEIRGFLAAGGMGEIYRAHDPRLGREVAIKILPRGDISRDQLARFDREVRAVGALNHRNILAVYDVGIADDVPYVVSELLDGETLRALLTRGRLPVDRARELAGQIASGLAAAHDKGIVHRDLKPENVFVTTDGLVKILDFGLAKQSAVGTGAAARDASLTGHGLVVGTAGYMSPEQVRGQHADARSDVFALGAVLYEMATGERAFTGDSAVETMNAVVTGQPPALPQLPAPFDRIVPRCLEKDRERRFASMRELKTALETTNAITGSSNTPAPGAVERPAPSAVEGAGRVQPMAQLRYIVASVLVIAGITAAGWFINGRQQPPGPGASGRPSLAVMPFEDRSGDPTLAWLSSGLPSMLITSLAQTPGLDLIGSDRLGASLTELGRDGSDRTARGEAARHAGAGAMLVGTLFKDGNDIRIDVQLEDVRSGRVVTASRQQGQDVFALVDGLAGKMRAALDVDGRSEGRPLRDMTTASLLAYELYVKGMDAWHNIRRADARTFFEEAVRIDPAFALAHSQLALVLESLGESARAQVHRRTVTGQLDRLPERQRLLAEAKQLSDSNPERALELTGRLLDRYPDEEEAYDLTVHIYSRNPSYENRTFAFLQQWGKAISGPGSGHFHNHYGYALLDHGLYTDAEREFRAYVRVSPNEANPHDSLAELLLLTGRPENAPEHYEQALRLNPLFGFSHLGLAYAGAMRGRYEDALASLSRLEELGARGGVSGATIHLASAFIRSRVGRYMEADAHVETARRIARESDDAAAEAEAFLVEAVLAWERRQTARAVEAAGRASRAAERIPGEALRARTSSLARLVGGTVEASAGHIESARAQLAAQRTLNGGDDAIQTSWQRALAGQIALSEGRLAEAEVAFREAEPAVPISRSVQSLRLQTGFGILANNQPFRDGLARVKAARGELKESIALYVRLNQPHITARWTAILEPRFVLAAARLADRAGDRDTARAEYTRFLELWKNADEGLPETREARRYLRGK